MKTYTSAETCLMLLYALPGEPLREGLYRKLFRAYQALTPENNVDSRDLDVQDLMRLGCNRETANLILYRLEQKETLHAYLRNLWNLGIQVVTRLSPEYPQKLRTTLGDRAPLILYCGGNLNLFSTRCISLVGSRNLRQMGKSFAAQAGKQIAEQGYTYCSGGATGADTAGYSSAMGAEGSAILFVADSLQSCMEQDLYRQRLRQGNLLLVSEFGYDQGFSPQRALSRNRLIHAMGERTLVAQSDYGFGGTWSGTMENLKQGWSPVYMCNEEPEHPGTRGLIERGATPILLHELKHLSKLQKEQLEIQ